MSRPHLKRDEECASARSTASLVFILAVGRIVASDGFKAGRRRFLGGVGLYVILILHSGGTCSRACEEQERGCSWWVYDLDSRLQRPCPLIGKSIRARTMPHQ